MTLLIRPAQLLDLDGLVALENTSFATDKLCVPPLADQRRLCAAGG